MKTALTDYGRNPKLGGAPVVFSAQATLATGKATVLNAQTLQSGFRTAYFIDEIRISMHTSVVDHAISNEGTSGLSGLVSVLFQTGKYQFSADAVPVGLLAPMFGTDYGRVVVGTHPQFRNFSTVRWALPKPLFMPAGDVVLANVSLATNGTLTALFSAEPCVTVMITYVGRLMPQGYVAPERNVPWLAWWQKNMTGTGGRGGGASSTYADATTNFRNPFKVPVHVQRFTQRTYKSVTAANATRHFSEENAQAQIYNTSLPYETIALQDSRGYVITKDFVPVGDVFDVARHAWTFGRELGPREQFNMQMATQNIAALPASTDFITNVGVVGYRPEAP
jgi:hypothetical protein